MGRMFHWQNSKTLKLLCIIWMLIVYSCGKDQQGINKSQPPAKVENAVKESKLSTVTISSQAEARLGIKVSPVENKNLPAYLKLGGEIIALPGNEVRIAAPAAGTILKSKENKTLLAGEWVNQGREIMRFLILPPENDLLGAREQVKVKQEQLQVAQAKAHRAKQLITNRAISEKRYQQIQVELTEAKAAWKAAAARLDLLSGSNLDTAARSLSTLVMESPIAGVLQGIYVAPGQTVPAGTVLFKVANLNPLWVKVPVYIGDLEKIDLQKEAVIKPLGTNNNSDLIKARPVQGPPLSNANSASADLYFEISNKNGRFRIGQKVSITLWQKSLKEGLVVPWSAIIYDIYGGNWVYTRIAPHTYTRQRVEVSHVVDDFAVLTRGVKIGDQVIITGAAEIFGTEFGVGK